MALSGAFLVLAGLWCLLVEPSAIWSLAFSAGLIAFGLFNMMSGLNKKLGLARANKVSLLGYLTAAISLYAILSRFWFAGYTTDTIVGTYLGVLKVAQLQSPYGFSIKPLMDALGFSPSYYTPGVDGTFDFRLAYPSLSFLSLVPLYLAGLHDLRDGVFLFYLVSVLMIFGLAPARLKSISIAPFGLFPFVIASSWTDSVWAFFIVLTAFLWYRHPKASWVTFGLAVAVKQVAAVVAPFLLIRLWYEKGESRSRSYATALGLMAGAFLLPNLPFIIASPRNWWADVVAPYLPNSPAQVPGGIGLSNFLLDLGIALPSTFYLVLMLGTSAFLLFAYARHYRGLNNLVFAFPILLFFFYYRSFPNYMAYWAFPLVLDFFQLGVPNLKRLLSFRLPSISWHSAGPFFRPFRQRLTPSIVVMLVLTTAFAGASGAYISQAAFPRVQIQINSSADPDSIGAATQISVTLTNLLARPVSPNFFVKFSPLPYYWPYNNTESLASGASRSYLLSAPDAYSAVPAGDVFHVMAWDNLTSPPQLLGESIASKADIPIPGIANPGLKWWILDQSLARKTPFGWKLSLVNTDALSSGVTPLGVNGIGGLTFELNYTSAAGTLEQLLLSQRVLFNSTRVQLGLNQALATDPSTKSMVLASVTDGTNSIFYVFSSQATQESIVQYATNATVTVPVTNSQWTSLRLDPISLWNAQAWGTPRQVILTVTIETASPGIYYASLDQVSPVTA